MVIDWQFANTLIVLASTNQNQPLSNLDGGPSTSVSLDGRNWKDPMQEDTNAILTSLFLLPSTEQVLASVFVIQKVLLFWQKL